MKKVKIEVMSDYNDCEQCGGGSEDGGRVTIDGVVVFEHIPVGKCYDNENVYTKQLLIEAIKALGGDVEIDYNASTGYEDYYGDDYYDED